jgi:hypothetical protein
MSATDSPPSGAPNADRSHILDQRCINSKEVGQHCRGNNVLPLLANATRDLMVSRQTLEQRTRQFPRRRGAQGARTQGRARKRRE